MPTKMQLGFNINADNTAYPSELFARMLFDDAALWTVNRVPAELVALTADIQNAARVLLAPQDHKSSVRRQAMTVLREAISEFSIDGKNSHVANKIGAFVDQIEERNPLLIKPEALHYVPK